MATESTKPAIPVLQAVLYVVLGAVTLFAFGYAISKGWKLGQK